MKKINSALEFASKKHEGQFRKELPVPYFVHIWEVYQILREFTDDEDTLVAAILHDTVEDTNTTFQEIEDNFGLEVRNLVDFCSEHDKSIPYLQRKAEHCARLKNAPLKAKLIKCADCISNWETTALDIKNGGNPWTKFNANKNSVKINHTMSLIALYEVKSYNARMFDRLFKSYLNIFNSLDKATFEQAKNLIAKFMNKQTKEADIFEPVSEDTNKNLNEETNKNSNENSNKNLSEDANKNSNEDTNKNLSEDDEHISFFRKFLKTLQEDEKRRLAEDDNEYLTEDEDLTEDETNTPALDCPKTQTATKTETKTATKTETETKTKIKGYTDCRQCPASEESLDSSPFDWFRDDDTKVRCGLLNRYVARSLEGWHEDVPVPDDCPLKKL